MDIGLLFAKYCDVKDLQEPHQNALSQYALKKLITEYESNRLGTRVIKFFAGEGRFIKSFFLVNTFYWFMSGIFYTIERSPKFFERFCLAIFCYAMYGIFKAIESKKSL